MLKRIEDKENVLINEQQLQGCKVLKIQSDYSSFALESQENKSISIGYSGESEGR